MQKKWEEMLEEFYNKGHRDFDDLSVAEQIEMVAQYLLEEDYKSEGFMEPNADGEAIRHFYTYMLTGNTCSLEDFIVTAETNITEAYRTIINRAFDDLDSFKAHQLNESIRGWDAREYWENEIEPSAYR